MTWTKGYVQRRGGRVTEGRVITQFAPEQGPEADHRRKGGRAAPISIQKFPQGDFRRKVSEWTAAARRQYW